MIDWGALGLVGLVSLAVGVIVVVLVAIALVGLSARELAEGESNVSPDAPAGGHDRRHAAGRARDGTRDVRRERARRSRWSACWPSSAIVIYGLSLVIFHH